jgi:cupin superfamily protein
MTTVAPRRAVMENLAGMSTENFVLNYWNRTYLHARPGLKAVEAALGGPWGVYEWKVATELGYNWDGSTRVLQALPTRSQNHLALTKIDPSQVDGALAAGATVIGDVLDARLSNLAAALKDQLNIPGPVSTYASMSPGGDAAVAHYDGSHVFVMQLEGRKLWRLSKSPAVTNPSRGRRISCDGEVDARGRIEDESVEQIDIDNLDTVVLEPGDLLYVPAGVVHATEALGRSFSVMVNFAPPRFDALVELIARGTLGASPEWRGLPAGPSPEFVNRGLDTLRNILARMDANSPEIQAAWAEMTANMGPLQNSFASGRHPREVSIEPGDRLCLNPAYPVRWSHMEDQVTVYLGEDKIIDSGAGAELLLEILNRREFNAVEACSWSGEAYDWEVVCGYLENLARQGLIVAG